ncbi:Octanoyltransferase [Astathelohania contejeani]|uniref:Octanoyltransferase n=1 Tax=Astathelohania contejeani TaxID=164912 RepID=A0ABQ7HWF3_9MICR|nr:Octanoyltransferase [Thelohania contejeani]
MPIEKLSKLILLGTGTSTGVPSLSCLLKGGCSVCNSKDEKNIRTNTSLLIVHNGIDILIDCGKDFRKQYERYLRKYNTHKKPPIVLLTHPHADAILGLDDLKQMLEEPSPLYGDKSTLDLLKLRLHYIFKKDHNNIRAPDAFVPMEINAGIPLTFDGLVIEPFYVIHGTMPCLGFKINSKIAYVSDCSSMDGLLENLMNLDLLIIECNTMELEMLGHFNFENVKKIVEIVQPKRTILTGMSHLMNYSDFKSTDGIEMGFDFMEIYL